METYANARDFTLYDVHPTFGQLLLRSPAGDGHATNIDIVFRGVFYLDLRAHLNGLTIEEVRDEDELRRLDARSDRGGRYEGNRYFAITSGAQRYYVGAGLYFVETNTLRWGETSLGITFVAPQEYQHTTWPPEEDGLRGADNP